MASFTSEKVLAEILGVTTLFGLSWWRRLPQFQLDDSSIHDKVIVGRVTRSTIYRLIAAATLVFFQCYLVGVDANSRWVTPLVTVGAYVFVRLTNRSEPTTAQSSGLLTETETSSRSSGRPPLIIPAISVVASGLLAWTDAYSIDTPITGLFLLLNGVTFFVCLARAARSSEEMSEKTSTGPNQSSKFVRFVAGFAAVTSIVLLGVTFSGFLGGVNLILILAFILRALQAFGLIYFTAENTLAAGSTITVATISTAILEDPSTLPGIRLMLAFTGSVFQVLSTSPKPNHKRVLLFSTLFLPGLLLPILSNIQLAPSAVKQTIIDPLISLPESFAEVHPVEKLHKKWTKFFDAKLARQSKTLTQAVVEYKRRYRRDPPPLFDKWFEYAQKNNYILVDEFDTLMQSIEPFWYVSPQDLIERSRQVVGTQLNFVEIEIKKGAIAGVSADHWYTGAVKQWFAKWKDLGILTDFKFTMNAFDEPRTMFYQELMGDSRQHFPGQENIDKDNVTFSDISHAPVWPEVAPVCPNQGRPELDDESMYTYTSHGLQFIDSGTSSQDICFSRSLRFEHGFFRSPTTMIVTHHVAPIFSQAVPQRYNDILYPTPFYYSAVDDDLKADSEDIPWDQKKNVTYWAGGSTGGYNTLENWKHIHRNRISLMTSNTSTAPVTILERNVLGKWKPKQSWWSALAQYFHVKVTRTVQCDEAACNAMKAQFDLNVEPPNAALEYKYLFDIDGNSYTGRYYRLLRSSSCVVKSTIFREWHDDLLTPWVHFIPLSNGASEFGEMMRFLITEPEGDAIGRRIGEQGKTWANRTLTREAMEVYALRVFMEYQRLLDEGREENGFDLQAYLQSGPAR